MPDPTNPDQQVVVRHLRPPRLEPGHRVQRRRTSPRPPRRSWSTAPPRASPGRCTSARTPTRCPSRPGRRRSRCCWPTASPCCAEDDDDYTPTPAVSRAIVVHNAHGQRASQTADGIVVTPSHNPPRDGGFKYNPPHGGPADTDATSVIAARANELLGDPSAIRRTPFDAGQRRHAPLRLPGRVLRGPGQRAQPHGDPRGRGAHRRRPDGRRQRPVLGLHRRAPGHRPDRGQPRRSTRSGRS